MMGRQVFPLSLQKFPDLLQPEKLVRSWRGSRHQGK